MLKIKYNNVLWELDAECIAYDGCHKIYIISNANDKAKAFEYGYDFYPVTDLKKLWEDSCSLRFIEFWDVENIKRPIIPQFQDAEIELDTTHGTAIIIPGSDVDMEDEMDEFIKKGVVWFGE